MCTFDCKCHTVTVTGHKLSRMLLKHQKMFPKIFLSLLYFRVCWLCVVWIKAFNTICSTTYTSTHAFMHTLILKCIIYVKFFGYSYSFFLGCFVTVVRGTLYMKHLKLVIYCENLCCWVTVIVHIVVTVDVFDLFSLCKLLLTFIQSLFVEGTNNTYIQ